MLKIRLSRFGKKKEPRFRIIVSENSKDPWGDYLDNLGTYNPQSKEVKLEAEKIKEYLAKGAQPSDTVKNILITQGVIEGKKSNVSHINKKRATKMNDAKAKEQEAKKAESQAKVAKEEAEKQEAVKQEAEKQEATNEAENKEAEVVVEEVKEAPQEESEAKPVTE